MAKNVPWDITTEILSRLPVKSLMRFKCVSKSFYSLISQDSDFKRKHLNQSNLRRAILYPINGANSVFSCPLSTLSSEEPIDVELVKLDLPVEITGRHDWNRNIYNCCDGLFCIGDKGGALIWNPFTRELKRLPVCPIESHKLLVCVRITYWLAHDSLCNHYKVLCSMKFYDIPQQRDHIKLKIYSMKTDSSWRKIPDFPYEHFSHMDCNFFNGAFHWFAINRNIGPVSIVSLDISSEKYTELALPQPIHNSKSLSLGVIKEKLSMLARGKVNEMRFDLWVMEEYGNMGSLTKMLTIPFMKLRCSIYKPLYLFDDRKLMIYAVIDGQEQVVIYEDGEVRKMVLLIVILPVYISAWRPLFHLNFKLFNISYFTRWV